MAFPKTDQDPDENQKFIMTWMKDKFRGERRKTFTSTRRSKCRKSQNMEYKKTKKKERKIKEKKEKKGKETCNEGKD